MATETCSACGSENKPSHLTEPWRCAHAHCARCISKDVERNPLKCCAICSAVPQVAHLPIFPVELASHGERTAHMLDRGVAPSKYSHTIRRYPPSMSRPGSAPNQGKVIDGCGFNPHWLETDDGGLYALYRYILSPVDGPVLVGVGDAVLVRGKPDMHLKLKPSPVQAEWLEKLADESGSDAEGGPLPFEDSLAGMFGDEHLAFIEACAHGCTEWAMALLELPKPHAVDVHFHENGAARLCISEGIGESAKEVAELLLALAGGRRIVDDREELKALVRGTLEEPAAGGAGEDKKA
jgi:hypothetical protein